MGSGAGFKAAHAILGGVVATVGTKLSGLIPVKAKLAYFDKSIAADPTYPLPHCGKGWVYEQQDKLDDAKKSYEAAVAADPKMPLPHRDLAELLEELSDFGVAAKHYRQYLELGGPDPDEDVKHAVERLSK